MCEPVNCSQPPNESKKSEPTSPRVWNYKATDLAALIAFVLSVFGYGWYLANWVRGADVQFFPPDQIELRCSELSDQACTADSKLTITASTMSYVNRGDAAYNAVLRRERVDVLLGSKKISLDWNYFSDITSASGSEKVATPRVIAGGQAESHETRFFPRIACVKDGCNDRRNFLAWSEFLRIITREDDPLTSISLNFTVTLFGTEKSIEKACTVWVDKETREQFSKKGNKLFAKTLPCVATAS